MIRGGVIMLNVSDVARAVRFYIETLGMKLVSADSEDSLVDALIIDAGDGFHLGLRKGAIVKSTDDDQPAIIFYPKVPIDDAIAIFENRGVTFKIDRKTDAKKKTVTVIARFTDDDGNLLALSSARADG